MTKLVIIVAIVIVVIALFIIIAFIIFRKCRKEEPVVKNQPTNVNEGVPGYSPDNDDDIEEYEKQYHPKAEVGDLYYSQSKLKGKINDEDLLV
jgi:flagellar basal body-associated protein FliL